MSDRGMTAFPVFASTCPHCRVEFTCANAQRVYCSDSCRDKASYARAESGDAAPRERDRICLECRVPFRAVAQRVICSDACLSARSRRRDVERERDIGRVLGVRARCRAWSETHRNVRRANHWLAGAPPFDRHLPGASCTIEVRPVPKWPIELRNVRGLHGALTSLLGLQHDGRYPNFAIRPWLSSWSVHWLADTRLAGGSFNGALYDRPTEFRFGPAVKLRAPTGIRRGRQRVRLEAITPVVIRTDGGARHCVRPTAESLIGTLAGETLNRISPDPAWTAWVRERVKLETIEIKTEPSHVDMGGKYGSVPGWQGHVDLEVNAVSRWLLESAARIGLGSRIAFGFGWTRVTVIE